MLTVRLILQMSHVRACVLARQQRPGNFLRPEIRARLAKQPQADHAYLKPRISQQNRRQQGSQYVYGETNPQAHGLPVKNIAQDDAQQLLLADRHLLVVRIAEVVWVGVVCDQKIRPATAGISRE